MATSLSRGTTIVGTATATWATTTNATDAGSATYATWVNATKVATGTITVGGYGFAPQSTSGLSVTAATGAFRHLESSTTVLPTVTCQLQDSTGTNIGTAQTVTGTTVAASASLTFGTPTAAQLTGGLRTLTSVTRNNSTTSATFSLDFIDVTVTYTLSQAVALPGTGVLTATAPATKFTFAKSLPGTGRLTATAQATKFTFTKPFSGAGALKVAYTAPASSLVDNFATQDTSKWTGWGGTFAVGSSQLQVTPAISGGISSLVSAQTYNLTSSSASVCLASFPAAWVASAGGSWMVLDMVSTTGSNNYLTIGLYTDSTITFATPVLLCSYVINNVQTIVAQPAYDYDAMKFVRLRHSGGTIFWDYSGDAANWTNAGSHATPGGITITKMNAYLQTSNGSSTSATGYYTNFNYFPDEALCVRDNFASQNTTLWGWGGGASVSGNQLVLACNATPTGTIWSGSPFFLYQGQIQWQMAQVAATNDATAQTGTYLLSRYGPTTPNDSLLDMHVINGLLKIDSYDNAGTLTNVLSIAYNSSTMPYQRFRVDETQVNYLFFDTASAANGPWTNRWNGTAPSGFNANTAFLQFFTTCATGSPSPSTAKFANININSAATSTLQDFFATKDTTKWDWFANAAVASQRLQLTATVNYDGAICTRDVFDFVGSSVQAQLVQVAGTNLTNCDNYLMVGNSQAVNDFLLFSVTNNFLIANYNSADPVGGNVRTLGSTTYNSVQHRWLRIRHDGGSPATIYFEASPDTNAWTQIASVAETALAQYITSGRTGLASSNVGLYNVAYAGLLAGLQSAGSPNQVAIWDNFNVTVYPGLLSGHGVLSATATAASGASRSVALSGHGVLSATATAKFSRAVALPGTGVLTAVATATKFTFTKNFAGSGVLSATDKPSLAGRTSGTGTLSATARLYRIAVAAALSGTGTLTAVARAKFSSAVALPGTGTFTATARMYRIASAAALPGHGTLSATTTPVFSRTATLTGTGALTATARLYRIASATALPGTGTLTATTKQKFATTAPFTGLGTLTATTKQKFAVSAALPGTGTLSATARLYRIASSVALAGTGTLTAATKPKFSVAVALPGTGTFTATAQLYRIAAATALPGHGALTASATAKFATAAALPGQGVLTATARMYRIASSAVLPGTGALTAIAKPQFVRAVSLTGSGVLTATAQMYRIAATVTPHGTGVLTATATAKFVVSTSLSGAGALTATARMYRIASAAALPGTGTLTATARPKFATAVTLSGTGALSALAVATKFVLPALVSGQGTLSATATAKYSRSVAVSGTGVLSATARMSRIAVSTALSGTGTLSASAVGSSGIAGRLIGVGTLSATAQMYRIAVAAVVSGQGVLSATVSPRLSASVVLSGTGVLSATAQLYQITTPAPLSGTGTLVATATPRMACTAVLPATGTLSVSARMYAIQVAVALQGLGQLSISTAEEGTRTAVLSGQGTLTATLSPRFSVSVALPGAGTLVSSASTTEVTALSGAGQLSALALLYQISLDAVLNGQGALSAAVLYQVAVRAAVLGTGLLSALWAAQGGGDLAGQGVLGAQAQRAGPGAHGNFLPFFFAGSGL